jgi:hypothetical protein
MFAGRSVPYAAHASCRRSAGTTTRQNFCENLSPIMRGR